MKTDERFVPAPPKACTCGRPVCLNRIKVQKTGTGRMLEGVFSQFGEAKGRNRKLALKPGYRFITWLPQCGVCLDKSPQQELAV